MNTEVVHYDMKQMLCHMFGVANKMLIDKTYNASIQFLYLLYNPIHLALPQSSLKEIVRVYHDTCQAAKRYDFNQIFGHVVDFLLETKKYHISHEDAQALKDNFCFVLCDQFSYRDSFAKV